MSTLPSAMTVNVSDNPSGGYYFTKGQWRSQETGLAELFVLGARPPATSLMRGDNSSRPHVRAGPVFR